jgi:DNA-directed RNA polymerase specialized sigma24 family protein
MHEKTEITREDLVGLLGRLADDANEAAKKYEEVRRGLINFFLFRGCSDSEYLADETITRVAAKLQVIETDEKFKFDDYFYSFANRIYLEEYRKRKKFVPVYDITGMTAPEKESDSDVFCMQKCLAKHPPDERTLLIKYYNFEKSGRAERRRRLAAELETDITSLQTKISRLRKILRECLKICLDKKKL